jgi:hypothetical protein
MVQEYYHKQQLQEPSMMTLTTTIASSYLNKVVISLDCIQIGNVMEEENDKMIIMDSNNGNRFTIPSCKVISVNKADTNNIIVDIEYQEVKRYRIVE